MHAAQKPKRQLKFATRDKESKMSVQWGRQNNSRICSEEDLAEKAQEIQVTIPVKQSQETWYLPFS